MIHSLPEIVVVFLRKSAGIDMEGNSVTAPVSSGVRLFLTLIVVGCCVASAPGQTNNFPPPPSAPAAEGVAAPLSLSSAMVYALEHNPELAMVRKQRGIAEAAVVIARTYPFTPIWETRITGANGPTSAGVTNHLPVDSTVRLDLEMRGQGRLRREAAFAALSRTEWEIATQELTLAIAVMRAFDAYLYRKAKLELLDQNLVLQEKSTERIKLLMEQGKLRAADLLLARADVVELRAQRSPSRSQMVAAWNDLRRLLAIEEPAGSPGPLAIQGSLAPDVPRLPGEDMRELALQSRPDLRAVQMAVREAEQRYRLEIANRYGNPTIGPAFEINETNAIFVGASIAVPLPVLNLHRGEILQRQAEKERAMLDQRRLEVQIVLDLQSAAARLTEAKKSTDFFARDVLPTLKTTVDSLDKLFTQGDPGVDVLRLIETQRRLLRARDANLDALWELHQGKADLAQALGNIAWIVNITLPSATQPGCAAIPISQPGVSELRSQPVADESRAVLLPPEASGP